MFDLENEGQGHWWCGWSLTNEVFCVHAHESYGCIQVQPFWSKNIEIQQVLPPKWRSRIYTFWQRIDIELIL